MTLTSYRFNGLELNNGIDYTIAWENLDLDARNTVEQAYLYRGPSSPLPAGINVQENTILLNIDVGGSYSSSAKTFDENLFTLYTFFQTEDPKFYKLERRLPEQSSYFYIEASPIEFLVDRINKKALITLTAPDRVWKQDTAFEVEWDLFDGNSYETKSVNYTGIAPYEPKIELTALTPGGVGRKPLYYREVTVWAWHARHIINQPLKVVENWNTSGLVAADKMRPDGLDITVVATWNGGTFSHRRVAGTENNRHVWIRPLGWNDHPGLVLSRATGDQDFAIWITCNYGTLDDIPSSGKLRLEDEIIQYTSITGISSDRRSGTLQISGNGRGVDGTTPASHGIFTRILQASVLRVSYGYSEGFKFAQGQSGTGWPGIDLVGSNNGEWIYEPTHRTGGYWPRWLGGKDPIRSDFINKVVRGTGDPAREDSNLVFKVFSRFDWDGDFRESTSVERMYLPLYRQPTRLPTQAQFYFDLENETRVLIYKTLSGFGTPQEDYELLWNSELNLSGSTQQIASPLLNLDQWFRPGSHIWFRIATREDSTSTKTVLTFKQVNFLMDFAYPMRPAISGLGPEKGIGTGEFPVRVLLRNFNDPQQDDDFEIDARMTQDQKITIDTRTKQVIGEPIDSVSYEQPIWLRLLPGNNIISFAGPNGVGQVRVKLRWRNNY